MRFTCRRTEFEGNAAYTGGTVHTSGTGRRHVHWILKYYLTAFIFPRSQGVYTPSSSLQQYKLQRERGTRTTPWRQTDLHTESIMATG